MRRFCRNINEPLPIFKMECYSQCSQKAAIYLSYFCKMEKNAQSGPTVADVGK